MEIPTLTIPQMIDNLNLRAKNLVSPMSGPLRRYYLSMFVLRHFLGEKWVRRKTEPEAKGHLSWTPESDAFSRFKYMSRVEGLAESLFNMQYIEGFKHRLKLLRNESVETGLAELSSAQLLVMNGIPFRFRVPEGKKGIDYDGELFIDAIAVACEMKAKLESTVPAEKSVVDTLTKARKQLPSNGVAGVVFIRLPSSWVEAPDGLDAMRQGVAAGLRSTTRIASVIAHWEEWHKHGENGAAQLVRLQEFRNDSAQPPLGALQSALSIRAPSQSSSCWVTIAAIAQDHEAEAQRFAILSNRLQRGWLHPVVPRS